MLDLLRGARFADVSANQWLGLTPASVVAATLNLDHIVLPCAKTSPLLMP
jgi:oxalate decarboxylase